MKILRPQSNQPLPKNAKKVFSGILFDVYQWRQKMFDRSYKTFEKITRRDTAGVIAITIDKKILLTKQKQPGMKQFLGTPGGIIDKNEDPLVAAKRELLEETGYESTNWSLFEAVQPTTKIDWAIFTFIAKDCQQISSPKLDSGEKVEVLHLTFEEFITNVKKDEFRDKELALKILRQITQTEGFKNLKNVLI